mgnify:CR=1 FL=1
MISPNINPHPAPVSAQLRGRFCAELYLLFGVIVYNFPISMNNFNYQNTTRYVFGHGEYLNIGHLLSPIARKVLLHYGGGSVIRSGVTGLHGESRQTIEYKLTLDSNPQFTASMLVATARAAVKMYDRGDRGCKTVLDIAPADLSSLSREEMLAHLL